MGRRCDAVGPFLVPAELGCRVIAGPPSPIYHPPLFFPLFFLSFIISFFFFLFDERKLERLLDPGLGSFLIWETGRTVPLALLDSRQGVFSPSLDTGKLRPLSEWDNSTCSGAQWVEFEKDCTTNGVQGFRGPGMDNCGD